MTKKLIGPVMALALLATFSFVIFFAIAGKENDALPGLKSRVSIFLARFSYQPLTKARSFLAKNKPWKQSASSQFGFTISHPKSWQQSEDQSLFYLVNTKSESKQFRAYITVTNLNPFGPDQNTKEVFEKIYTTSDNSSVSNYFQKSQLTQSSETKTKNSTLDGQNAVMVSQDTIMPGPYYSTNVYILKGDKVWVIRLIASSKEELSGDTQIFNSIAATFKFTN